MGRVKDPELFDLIRDFLTVYLPVHRKVSGHTIRSYRITLNQFLQYLADRKKIAFASVTFSMISRESAEAYLEYICRVRNVSPATRNSRLAAIKSFLSYASGCRPEYIASMNEVQIIKSSKDDPFSKVDFMTEAAVKALMETPDTRTKIGLRDQFFMIMLYDTGGRVQEIIDIRICDIRMGKTASVFLHGKGNRTRQVPLMAGTMEHLKNYLRVFHPEESAASTEFLFYSVRDGVRNQISDDAIRIRFNKYAAKARKNCGEVPENVHPHLWRHSRAMHLYQHGMDLTLVSQWLGHRQLETTLIYAHADTELKRKAIETAMGEKENISFENPEADNRSADEKMKKLYGLK